MALRVSSESLADGLSRILDRRIVYSPATPEEYREHLGKFDLPEFVIQHFLAIAIDYQNGIFAGIDGVIGQITGQAPQTVEQYVNSNLQVFQR